MRPEYAEILDRAGFGLIVRLDYRLRLTAWWNPAPEKLMELLVVPIGDAVIVKAGKSYYMKSVSEAGQTWARDIPALHDWLETHLPEVRVACSILRDVPLSLAAAAATRRPSATAEATPPLQRLVQLERQLRHQQNAAAIDARLTGLPEADGGALADYLYHCRRRDAAGVQALQTEIAQQREQLDASAHLQREYQRKGSAVAYSFTIHSNLQVAFDANEFTSALRAVTREIQDQHRYQVTQKLQGGRLHIQIAEADEPAVTWIEQWLGGTLSPTQLATIEASGRTVPIARDHIMVVPDERIVCPDGHAQADAQHLGARVLSTVVGRLDTTEAEAQRRAIAREGSATAMPLRIGTLIDEGGRDLGPAVLPLEQIVHGVVSGTTGSGKSYLARVLVEEAAQIAGLGVLVIDPRNQFAGLLVAEDRPAVLEKYQSFGMSVAKARGFDFAYHAPAMPAAPLPGELASLASGRAIVSLKGLDDAQRCERAAAILNAVFDALSRRGESDRPRLMIVIDEAHLFTRKRLIGNDASTAGAAVESAIDRFVRESRKYGGVLLLISQSLKDFARDLASVRQMAGTKIFLRNADTAIDDAASVLGDARALVNLPTGVALAHNAAWGVRRIRVRPPYSKVCELDDGAIRTLIGQHTLRAANAMSTGPRDLLEMLRRTCGRTGPLNMSQVAEASGITSKRRLQTLIRELADAGLLTSIRLSARGSPRHVMPVAHAAQP